jgi:AraC-like DNA-binding protein
MPRVNPQHEIGYFGLQCWAGEPQLMAGPHQHNDMEFNYLERGEMTYLFGRAPVTVRAGQLALFWGAVPHQLIRLDEGTRLTWATLPLAWLLRWRLPDALVSRVLEGAVLFDQSPLDAGLFAQWRADLETGSAEREDIVLLEMEARVRRLALVTAGALPQPTTPATSKAEQMALYIAAHYTEPLSLRQVAASAGLHPNYAARLFRGAFGRSVLDYITQHRIAHAQRLLVTTEASVLDIALEAGFGSASRFYSAFRRACGQSPREYRARLKGFAIL